MKKESEIKTDYYIRKLPIKDIVHKYDVPRYHSNPSKEQLHSIWPPYIHPSLKCEYCEAQLSSTYLNRNTNISSQQLEPVVSELKPECIASGSENSIQNFKLLGKAVSEAIVVEHGYKVSLPVCTACGHYPITFCTCRYCNSVKEENRREVAEEIFQRYSASSLPIPSALTCRDLLELLEGFAEVIGIGLRDLDHMDVEKLNIKQHQRLVILGVLLPIRQSIRESIEMSSVFQYSFQGQRFQFSLMPKLDLATFVFELKGAAALAMHDPRQSWSIVDIWEGFAIEEAIGVLDYYCDLHGVSYLSSSNLVSLIQKSLSRFGLAQTSRYLCNSVRRAHTQMAEIRDQGNAVGFICGNLSFWIEDERAREYVAHPFRRGDSVLSEPLPVAVFSNYFLEPNRINYLTTPIGSLNLNRQD